MLAATLAEAGIRLVAGGTDCGLMLVDLVNQGITGDIAAKAADIELAYVDRFSGSLLITGQLTDVEAAVKAVVDTLTTVLGFTPAPITRT